MDEPSLLYYHAKEIGRMAHLDPVHVLTWAIITAARKEYDTTVAATLQEEYNRLLAGEKTTIPDTLDYKEN